MQCDVADVIDLDGHPEESEANARLISASPDLLEACKAMAHAVEQDIAIFGRQPMKGSALRLAQEAIAKAEGHPAKES